MSLFGYPVTYPVTFGCSENSNCACNLHYQAVLYPVEIPRNVIVRSSSRNLLLCTRSEDYFIIFNTTHQMDIGSLRSHVREKSSLVQAITAQRQHIRPQQSESVWNSDIWFNKATWFVKRGGGSKGSTNVNEPKQSPPYMFSLQLFALYLALLTQPRLQELNERQYKHNV